MSFELKLAVQGKLSEFLSAEAARAARAVTLGIPDSVESGKQIARQQVRAAGMGDRLANSWRHKVSCCSIAIRGVHTQYLRWSRQIWFGRSKNRLPSRALRLIRHLDFNHGL